MTDLAHKPSVDKRNKALKRARALADEGVKIIMASQPARLYLAELLRDSQALLTVAGATEQGAMFREGRKVMGLKIMADVQRAVPQQFAALIEAVITPPNEDPPKDKEADGTGTDADE